MYIVLHCFFVRQESFCGISVFIHISSVNDVMSGIILKRKIYYYYRLSYICKEEGIECDDDTLNVLVETSGGDMRRAITCLQSCAKLVGSNMKIDKDSVLEVTGVRIKNNSFNFHYIIFICS